MPKLYRGLILQRRKTQLKSLLFISGCECGSQGAGKEGNVGGGGECKMGWSPARPETGGVDQQGNAFESNMAFSFPFAQFGDSFNYSVSFCPFSCYILVCM